MRSLKEIIGEHLFYKYHDMADNNIFLPISPEGILVSIITTTAKVHMAQIVWTYNGKRQMTYISLDKPKYLSPTYVMDETSKQIAIKMLLDNWNIVENVYPEIKTMPDYSKLPSLK